MEEENIRQKLNDLNVRLDSTERKDTDEVKEKRVKEKIKNLNDQLDSIEIKEIVESENKSSDSSFNQEGSPAKTTKVHSSEKDEYVVGNDKRNFPKLGGKYEVLEYIGDGGMGAVYKVKDNELDSIVAIKVLKQELVSDKATLKRFEQESKSLSELHHPNLVTVYGSGQMDDGTPYITMDYLDGEDLAAILKRENTLELNRVINLTEQICDGLSHAHKNGVVHRDIKPSNILITNYGGKESVKILDFGIARIVDSTMGNTTNLTQTGEVFGTPTYMSPEQCETGEIDKRSDVYSLGCVMYEMLIGKPPFQGVNPIQVAVKHINDEPEKFSKKLLKSKSMQSMESIILSCLSKEPEHRYKSTESLKADLSKLLSGIKVNRFLVKDKDTRPKWLSNCCRATLIFSIYGIAGVTMVQIGDLNIKSNNTTAIPAIACSFFIIFNLIGLIMFTLCTKVDLKSIRAVDAKTSHFWQLGESASITFILWLGAILYSAPLIMNVNSGLTGFIASTLGFVFIMASLIFAINACLASISSMKIFKKWDKPLSKRLVIKQWLTALATAIIFTIPFAILLPKALSYIPLGLGVMITSPAPHFATKLVDLSIALNSSNQYALIQKAYIATATGSKNKAIATVNNAVKLNPESTRVLYARAKILRYVGKNQDALKDLTKLIQLKPNEASYYKVKANLELDLKQYKSAIADFSELIKLEPKNGNNYRKRALLYALGNNFDGANEDMAKALISSSTYNSSEDYLRIAMINDLAGNKNKAKEFYQKTLDESSDYDHYVRAYANKQLGNMKEFKKENNLVTNKKDSTSYFKGRILFDLDFPMNW